MSPVAAPEAAAKPAARLSRVNLRNVGKASAALERILPGSRRTVEVAGFSSSI